MHVIFLALRHQRGASLVHIKQRRSPGRVSWSKTVERWFIGRRVDGKKLFLRSHDGNIDNVIGIGIRIGDGSATA
jgi:hypothetical protein